MPSPGKHFVMRSILLSIIIHTSEFSFCQPYFIAPSKKSNLSLFLLIREDSIPTNGCIYQAFVCFATLLNWVQINFDRRESCQMSRRDWRNRLKSCKAGAVKLRFSVYVLLACSKVLLCILQYKLYLF